MSSQQDQTIRGLFTTAKNKRADLGSYASATDVVYQENLRSAIECLEKCRELADRISMFSPNETLEDVASADIQYLLIDYYIGDLALKQVNLDRKNVLKSVQEAYERYLHLLDSYRMLSKGNSKLFERFVEDRNGFSLMASNDAAIRRDTKVKRFREEKELKAKLERIAQNPRAAEREDAVLRELYLAEIEMNTHQTFQALDMIAQEHKILALMPPKPPPGPGEREADYRERNGLRKDEYSDRLDSSLPGLYRSGQAGPILSKEGKPLQPFTLLDTRQRLQNGVFRPDHSLPTMTIDEYLDEEKRRGGMVDGGGEQNGIPAEVDEDDMDRADVDTMKAREWDEFTEANPKGSGNTMNRG